MTLIDQIEAFLIGAWNADAANDTELLAVYAARARAVLTRLEEYTAAKRADVERLERRVRGGQ